LPLADEGWQTYQPPLYYLLAAGWLKLAGFTRTDLSAVAFLRWLGLVAGVLQALFVLLALRELMPRRPGLVLCAFVFGMSLPVNLYLFQMITNEAWVAMLSSGALWWTIRMLRRAECSLREHAILGLFLGLAMLAKFSALIPLVLCPGVLLAQRWLRPPSGLGPPLTRLVGPQLARPATTFAVVLVVCGWHYLRVARRAACDPGRTASAHSGRRALAGAGRAAACCISLRRRRTPAVDHAHRPRRGGAQAEAAGATRGWALGGSDRRAAESHARHA
jgi:hypothetical protein